MQRLAVVDKYCELKGIKMKSRKEIISEIKAAEKTLENYRKAYKNSEMSKDTFALMVADCQATIDALKWVLGKNDRFD